MGSNRPKDSRPREATDYTNRPPTPEGQRTPSVHEQLVRRLSSEDIADANSRQEAERSLMQKISDVLHRRGNETPEKNRERFLQRSTDTIRELKKHIQSTDPRLLNKIHLTITKMEGSYIRHENHLIDPDHNFTTLKDAYHEDIALALNTIRTSGVKPLGSFSDIDQITISDAFEAARKYV